MHLSISRAAEADISGAAEWYDRQRPGLGTEFFDALEHLFEHIETSPESFPRDELALENRHIRSGFTRRFPYRVIFEITSQGAVVVLAVAHTSRHPDRWKPRSS